MIPLFNVFDVDVNGNRELFPHLVNFESLWS